MLQQDIPDDYVIATGTKYSIRDFLTAAFEVIGIEDWGPFVKQDPRFMRPAEVDVLLGDYSKAKETLGWEPKTSFEDLVKIMVKNDITLLSR
jgi:GDPmannose 4,6-dehydratase